MTPEALCLGSSDSTAGKIKEGFMSLRTCSKCGQIKDESEFSWSIKGIKKHSICKPCRSNEHSNYYERNKEKVLKYKWERQMRKREDAGHYVYSYLNSHSCIDCGETDPVVLTFDRVRGKKKWTFPRWLTRVIV